MSENTEIWNLNALCRCCHKDGYFKSLQDTFIYENEIEVYAQMLRDTFDLEIKQPITEASNTICEDCIVKLRDSAQFKKQVITCEKKFEVYCKNELIGNGMEPVKIEVDFDNDYDADFNNEIEIEYKYDNNSQELAKKEENDFDGSCNGDKPIKSEISEDIKTSNVQIALTPTETDAKESEIKKKKVKKNIKTSNVQITLPPTESDVKESELKKKNVKKNIKIKTKKKTPVYDSSLEVHVKTETGTLYSCKLCGGSYDQRKHIKKHIKTNHSIYPCLHCEETFTCLASRATHMKYHKQLKCQYCKKSYRHKFQFKIHLNTHTKAEKYICDLCSKEFSCKQTLAKHLKGHYGTKKKCICHICGRSFNDNTNLRKHIMTVHERLRPYACEMCPKTFTEKRYLTVHIRTHTGEKPFACDQCPEKFICLSYLKDHKQSVHNNIPRYECIVCKGRWSDKKLFLRHVKRAHAGLRPYKCTICEKDFTCKYTMKRHVEEHSGVKMFSCDQCGAEYFQRGALNRHVKIKHVAVEVGVAEKCDVCHKNVFDLKKHMQCHNNKRFSCEYCGKSYSEKNVLTRHKKFVHLGIKPHVCEYCDKKYVKINGLRNHLMKVHRVVSKVENDEDFDSAVAKFSIKNKKGKIKTEDGLGDIPFNE